MDSEFLINMLVSAPPLLLGLTIHEFAHARTALAYGDPTARNMGRCSLNPLVHLDFMGTICLLFSGIMGWAKPVPVNKANLHPPRLGDIMVSLAGPASNLLLAVLLCILLRIFIPVLRSHPEWLDSDFVRHGLRMVEVGIIANIGLFAFNLVPLFPLDGHHILREALPEHHHYGFMDWQVRYGAFVLLGLVLLPRILERVTGRDVFDPLGELQMLAIRTILPLVGL